MDAPVSTGAANEAANASMIRNARVNLREDPKLLSAVDRAAVVADTLRLTSVIDRAIAAKLKTISPNFAPDMKVARKTLDNR